MPQSSAALRKLWVSTTLCMLKDYGYYVVPSTKDLNGKIKFRELITANCFLGSFLAAAANMALQDWQRRHGKENANRKLCGCEGGLSYLAVIFSGN
jgi:hypothetical protein